MDREVFYALYCKFVLLTCVFWEALSCLHWLLGMPGKFGFPTFVFAYVMTLYVLQCLSLVLMHVCSQYYGLCFKILCQIYLLNHSCFSLDIYQLMIHSEIIFLVF